MTNEIGFLRQVLMKGAAQVQVEKYQLSQTHEVAIGRDRNCQIALESIAYGMVSRRHATVRPLTKGNFLTWEICDLSSANGTYSTSGCYEVQ